MKKSIFLSVGLLAVMFVLSLAPVSKAKSGFVTLTGQILNDATMNGLPGVTVTASNPIGGCGYGWTGGTTTTNGFGYYSMSVPDDCYFILTPTKGQFSFKPSSRQVTPVNVGSTFDFVGIPD